MMMNKYGLFLSETCCFKFPIVEYKPAIAKKYLSQNIYNEKY